MDLPAHVSQVLDQLIAIPDLTGHDQVGHMGRDGLPDVRHRRGSATARRGCLPVRRPGQLDRPRMVRAARVRPGPLGVPQVLPRRIVLLPPWRRGVPRPVGPGVVAGDKEMHVDAVVIIRATVLNGGPGHRFRKAGRGERLEVAEDLVDLFPRGQVGCVPGDHACAVAPDLVARIGQVYHERGVPTQDLDVAANDPCGVLLSEQVVDSGVRGTGAVYSEGHHHRDCPPSA